MVTLNRPASANAFDTAMASALATEFEALGAAGSPWQCVIVTGAGDRTFCAGADLKERVGMSNADWIPHHRQVERMIEAILDCPIPVIAAVNGAAFGGGCEIALACDFIYADASATFALPEVKRGIMPGAGGTQNLPRAVGSRAALEMLLTGEAIDAAHALRIGLCNAVVEGGVVQAALARAATIARNAPLSVREIKRAVREGAGVGLREALALELEGYHRLIPTEDRGEGIVAFVERRAPRFRGR